MDYVIAGLAAGAGLAIVGFLLREAGLSKRLSLPLWLADAGLALMSAAVVTWLLTFTAITTDLDVREAATIIGAGSVVALVAAFALVLHSGSRRRALMRPRMPAPQTQVVTANVVVTTLPPPAPVEQPLVEPEPEEPQARTQQDWEEIWRATWGSGELPRRAERPADPVPDAAPVANPSWESWSSNEDTDREKPTTTANAAAVDAADESPGDPSMDLDSPTTNSNGAHPISERVEEHD